MTKKLEDIALIMMPGADKAAIAKVEIAAGTSVVFNDLTIEIKDNIRIGHRFAVDNIESGEYITQYGYPFCKSKGISQGEAITVKNIDNEIPAVSANKTLAEGKLIHKEEYLKRTFKGFKRNCGRAGTRNFYLIIPASLCAGETARWTADTISRQAGDKFSNVDGIAAIPHTEGCGCASNFQIDRLKRMLWGYINHPNVCGCLIIDLGCEKTNRKALQDYLLNEPGIKDKPVDWLTIQECGGTASTVKEANEIALSRLATLNRQERELCPISEITVGTECGASDSFSGITANPVIGSAVDRIIYGGGSAIISEIPEMLGTYNMLYPRFRSEETAAKFDALIKWYEDIACKLGVNLYDNLVPKNMEGGLLNSYIKSIGAALKGGTTIIEDVIDYAEPIKKRGLNIMQGPGADPESVSGLVASGANMICFSTGYGAISGNPICPVIKITSNSITFNRMKDDMDFDAGRILTANAPIESLGNELFELIIEVASGKKTCTEKTRQNQFQVWTAGKLSL